MALSCTDLRHDVRRTRWHVAVLRATYVKRPTIDRIASVSCLSIGSKRSVSQGALELFSIRPFHASETNVRRERKRERERGREGTNEWSTHEIHYHTIESFRSRPIDAGNSRHLRLVKHIVMSGCGQMQIWASCFQERHRYPRSMGIFDKEFLVADTNTLVISMHAFRWNFPSFFFFFFFLRKCCKTGNNILILFIR